MKFKHLMLILSFLMVNVNSVLFPVQRFYLRGISFIGPIRESDVSRRAWELINEMSPIFFNYSPKKYERFRNAFEAQHVMFIFYD